MTGARSPDATDHAVPGRLGAVGHLRHLQAAADGQDLAENVGVGPASGGPHGQPAELGP